MRAYGIDVTDPTTDLRRIHLAVKKLPMGMWPVADHAASWSAAEYLLANLVDAVRELAWITVQVNSKSKVKKPEPTYRPGARKPAGGAPKIRWADLPRALGAPAPPSGSQLPGVKSNGS